MVGHVRTACETTCVRLRSEVGEGLSSVSLDSSCT